MGKKLFFTEIIISSAAIAANIIIFRISLFSFFLPFINIFFFIIITVIFAASLIYDKKAKSINSNNNAGKVISGKDTEDLKKLSDKAISFIIGLKDFLKKISEFTEYENGRNEINGIFDQINGDLFNKSSEKKTEIIDMLQNAVDYDKVFELLDELEKFDGLIESAYKITFVNKLLKHSVSYTEKATLTLIDKFDILATDIRRTKTDTEENVAMLKDGIKGKSFKEVIDDSKGAIKEYEIILDKIVKINKNNVGKIEKFTEWINKIQSNINNIMNISEKNNIIAINSSIEAAKLGNAGKGFRILSNEIRDLNTKVNSFTSDIKNIMNGFMEFNKNIVQDLTSETQMIIDNIKETSKRVEQIMFMLIYSYNILSGSFESTVSCADNIQLHMNDVLVAMQFQDITRQQIESVMNILLGIRSDILDDRKILDFSNADQDKRSKLFNEAREYMLNNIKHFDISKIKIELEEEKI